MALFGRKKKTENVVVDVAPEPVVLRGAPATRPDGLRPLTAHMDYLLGLIEPLPPFGMSLLDGVGLSLCEDLEADQNLPRHDLALIDGVAVRAVDVAQATHENPVLLHHATTLEPGDIADGKLLTGEAVVIAAGCPLPEGADAVVPPEATGTSAGGTIRVVAPVRSGAHVRRCGSDTAEGEMLLKKGQTLDPRTVGRLASVGIDRVIVRPRPRVVVVAAGADLIDPSARTKKDSDSYDTSSFLVASAAKLDGAQVWRVPVHEADSAAIADVITDQLIRADLVVITTGGTRTERDQIRTVMAELGPIDFVDIAVEPGREQSITLVGPDDDRVPVVLLSGDPADSYVSYITFVRPLVRKLMAREPYVQKGVRAITATIIRAPKDEVALVCGVVTEEIGGRHMVEPVPLSSEHQLGDLTRANALIVVPEGQDMVRAGDPVQVLLLDEE